MGLELVKALGVDRSPVLAVATLFCPSVSFCSLDVTRYNVGLSQAFSHVLMCHRGSIIVSCFKMVVRGAAKDEQIECVCFPHIMKEIFGIFFPQVVVSPFLEEIGRDVHLDRRRQWTEKNCDHETRTNFATCSGTGDEEASLRRRKLGGG